MKSRLVVKFFIVGVFENNSNQGTNNGRNIKQFGNKNPGGIFHKNEYF